MRKKVLAVLLIISAVGVMMSACGKKESSDAKKVIVGIMGSSKKMSYTDDKGNFTGYEAEVIKAIDKELKDYDFEFFETDFASLFVALQGNKVDMVSGNLRRSDERESNYIHTYRAYNYTPYRITVPESNTTINSIKDLSGKKVGISQGSLQATILERYNQENNANIELVYTKDAIGDLMAGRLDAIINPQFSVLIYNDSYENVKFKNVGDPVVSKEGNGADSNAYFYFAKGNEKLRDEVSEAIYKLKQDGTLSKLAVEFFGEDYPSNIDVSKEEEQIKNK